MFEEYTFIMVLRDEDMIDDHVVKEELSMGISPLNLLSPLQTIDFKSGDETTIMSKTLIAFIEELDKTFNIINLT